MGGIGGGGGVYGGLGQGWAVGLGWWDVWLVSQQFQHSLHRNQPIRHFQPFLRQPSHHLIPRPNIQQKPRHSLHPSVPSLLPSNHQKAHPNHQ